MLDTVAGRLVVCEKLPANGLTLDGTVAKVQRPTSSVLAVVVGLVAVACASARPHTIYFDPGSSGSCDGEEFVEVNNRTAGNVDVYANTSGEIFSTSQGALIGSASRGTTRLTLEATAVQGRPGGFSARLNGQYVQDVSFRRGCELRQ